MEHYDLSFGGVASEEQLRMGSLAPANQQTGPKVNYYLQAVDFIKAEVARLDTRIKSEDVNEQLTPERYPTWYSQSIDKKSGFIGDSQYRFFFYYLYKDGYKYRRVNGYGRVKILQESKGTYFVKQIWKMEELKITYQE